MNRICVRFTASVFIGGLLAGTTIGMAWGQTPTPAPTPAASKPASLAVETPEPADKVVLKVGAKQFTKADMDSLIGSLTPQAQQAIATQPQAKQKLGDQYALSACWESMTMSAYCPRTDQPASEDHSGGNSTVLHYARRGLRRDHGAADRGPKKG